jgi:HK97 family phage major capsid protein
MTVTKGAWEDGTVAEAIRTTLDYEIRAEVETDVLVGDGTGQHLTGVVNTAGVLTQARSTDPRIAAILKAAGQIRAASNENFGRDGLDVILSPADALTVALETATGSGEYALDDAAASLALLNVRRFVISPFLTAGTSVVGDFSKASIYSRSAITVEVADAHDDHFVLGLVDPLVTWRAGFVVNFPKAFCVCTGM